MDGLLGKAKWLRVDAKVNDSRNPAHEQNFISIEKYRVKNGNIFRVVGRKFSTSALNIKRSRCTHDTPFALNRNKMQIRCILIARNLSQIFTPMD